MSGGYSNIEKAADRISAIHKAAGSLVTGCSQKTAG